MMMMMMMILTLTLLRKCMILKFVFACVLDLTTIIGRNSAG